MEARGLSDIKKALKKLPTRIQKNVLVGATRAGCKPILTKARQNAPVDSGDLKKSIKIKKRRSKNRAIVKFSVSAGNVVDGEKKFYSAFIEWGYTKPNGTAVMAHPFMRPAFESEGEKSIEAFKVYARKRIPKEIEKLGR